MNIVSCIVLAAFTIMFAKVLQIIVNMFSSYATFYYYKANQSTNIYYNFEQKTWLDVNDPDFKYPMISECKNCLNKIFTTQKEFLTWYNED